MFGEWSPVCHDMIYLMPSCWDGSNSGILAMRSPKVQINMSSVGFMAILSCANLRFVSQTLKVGYGKNGCVDGKKAEICTFL